MNKKVLYENIMKKVAKSIKTTLNEYGDHMPIGFFTDEEREQLKKDLEDRKSKRNLQKQEIEISQLNKIANIQAKMTIDNSQFCIIVDELSNKLKLILINSETIGVQFIEINENSTAIICYSLEDYIAILKMMDKKYENISCRTIAHF